MSTERPNILLIHSDQHRCDCVGCNGHPLLRTPNLDRLAREGTNFTHAFTPAPICSPARASLVSGQWPTQHGVISIPHTEAYHPPRPDMPIFPPLLREAGYLLAHVGKFHGETAGPPTDHGMHEYVDGSGYGVWRKAQGIEPEPHDSGWLGQVDPYITPDQSRLAWGAGQAAASIERFAAESRPFFVRWDPGEPHLPCCPPEPYASMYPPERIEPWPSFFDELVGKPYIQAQQRRTWRLEGWGWDRWAPVVSRYLGVISLLDAQVGRLLDTLDRLGLADNTLVVYTTDHGDLCGGHGMIDKNYVMYDDVVRVPLIVRLPGAIPAGRTCEEFVCHSIDLASTFCEAAGVEPPATFTGHGLLRTARGENSDPRTDIFATWHGAQFGLYSQRMVRNRRWKYIWNPTAPDELYDLRADPGELTNLAHDAACGDVLAEMRERLIRWMETIDDPMLNQWTRDQLADDLKI